MIINHYLALITQLNDLKQKAYKQLPYLTLHSDATLSIDISSVTREEMVKEIIAVLVELGCGEEEFYCKSTDYINERR